MLLLLIRLVASILECPSNIQYGVVLFFDHHMPTNDDLVESLGEFYAVNLGQSCFSC